MTFTEENTVTLYHYFKELQDSLRPILNTKQYNQVDEHYWVTVLTNLANLIDKVLETKTFEPFPDTEADGIVFCGKCGKQK